MTRAFVFPGQGSQAVGMGRDLAEAFPVARQTFEEVDDALNVRLSRIMFDGPEADLTLTENAQPALMAVSMAIMRVLRLDGSFDLTRQASHVAGHSLGEYAALAAAGTFHLSDAARLLRLRGRSMQQAVPVGEGAMAAILGADLDAVQAIAAEAARRPDGGDDVCACANDNAPGQVVVSGHRAAVERAIKLAAERGFKRAIMLPVSAPFHCALMAPAATAMREALETVIMHDPAVPLIANVTAGPVTDSVEIRRRLVEQVTGMVRWRESVLAMKDLGVTALVEVGTGKVLAGLAKRIDKELSAVSINGPADIEAFLKTI
jgi:[acyl-carrier-protein] S-malonyltransferase